VALQSGAKYQFDNVVYYTTLNSNCVARSIKQFEKKKIREAQINAWVIGV
jgi:hypothetical protein